MAALLVLIAIGLAAVELLFGYDHLRGIVPMFSLTMEANVPTWFSGGLLLTASTLLLLVAHDSGRGTFGWAGVANARHWYGLGIVFAYLSLDELTQLHERTTQPVRDGLGTGGLLYYGWIVPALLLVAIIGAIYLRFLFRLPRATARLFVLAAILYVGGAVGGEMLEGLTYSSALEPFTKRFTIKAITITEEAAEMCGVIVMIRALLLYVAANRERTGSEHTAPPEPSRAARLA